MPKCETCAFSTARPREKLIRERWEEDPRPIRNGWKSRWWNPHDYKDESPYEGLDPSFLEMIDKYREIDNQTLMHCDRFPERVIVNRSYVCGEYNEID